MDPFADLIAAAERARWRNLPAWVKPPGTKNQKRDLH